MKIKIIGSYDFTVEGEHYRFNLPYGAAIVAHFLKKRGLNVVLDDILVRIKRYNEQFLNSSKMINLRVFDDARRVLDYVYKNKSDAELDIMVERIIKAMPLDGYDLLGMSIHSYFHCLVALSLTRQIKKRFSIKVILGGAFITRFGKDYFDKSDFLDYMIVGDGQYPLYYLIKHLEGQKNIKEVPSLLYRKGDKVFQNTRNFYKIDELCTPDFTDLPLEFYKTKPKEVLFLTYQISRGCSYNCNFCTYKSIEPQIELLPVSKIISDIKYMKDKYNSNHFSFITAAVNLSREYLNDLCDALIEEELDIIWNANARLDNLDKEILNKMKKSGCEKLYFGLETASNRILILMGKEIKIEQARQSLQLTHEAGIKTVVNIMYGLPHETREDISTTVEFIKEYNEYIDKTSFNQFMLMAGSPLADNPQKYGVTNLRNSEGEFDTRFVYFAFDEIKGLNWKDKLKQTKEFEKILLKTNFKYIIRKELPFFKVVPFFVYYYWRNGIKAPYKSYFSVIVAKFWPLIRWVNNIFRKD